MTRAELHRIVDELPDSSVEVAGALLRRAAEDPDIAALLGAPWDDEPYTEVERSEDGAALARLDRGERIDWQEAKQRLQTG